MQSDKVDFSELEHYLKPVDSIFANDELLEETNEFIINSIESKRYQQGQYRQHQQHQHQQRQQLSHHVDDTTKLWMWNNHAIGSRNEHKNQNSINNAANYNNLALDSNLKSTYSNFNYSLTAYHHHHPSIDLSGRPPLQVTNIPSNTSNNSLQLYQSQHASIQQPNHQTTTLTNAKDKDISLSDNHNIKTKINQVILSYSTVCSINNYDGYSMYVIAIVQ